MDRLAELQNSLHRKFTLHSVESATRGRGSRSACGVRLIDSDVAIAWRGNFGKGSLVNERQSYINDEPRLQTKFFLCEINHYCYLSFISKLRPEC